MSAKNETAERLYNEAQIFEGSRPSGLLVQGADEIYKLQRVVEDALDAYDDQDMQTCERVLRRFLPANNEVRREVANTKE